MGGRKVEHTAGQKVIGNTAEEWLKLRDQHPEIFQEFVLMQQPSATFDEIIVSWDLEDLAHRFPAVVLQRDLQSGALSCRSRMAALLLNIVCCWIGPGMTPVTQLTDTDFAKPFKEFLEVFKVKMARMLKEEVLAEGRKFSMKYRPMEIMYVMQHAIRAMKKHAEEGQLGIHGLRRNSEKPKANEANT